MGQQTGQGRGTCGKNHWMLGVGGDSSFVVVFVVFGGDWVFAIVGCVFVSVVVVVVVVDWVMAFVEDDSAAETFGPEAAYSNYVGDNQTALHQQQHWCYGILLAAGREQAGFDSADVAQERTAVGCKSYETEL